MLLGVDGFSVNVIRYLRSERLENGIDRADLNGHNAKVTSIEISSSETIYSSVQSELYSRFIATLDHSFLQDFV
jgi:hypothetical protein